MKTRDIKALHTKDISELRNMLNENRTALTNARLELGQQKLASTSSMTNFRRDIARIQTVMRMKASSGVKSETIEEKKTESKVKKEKGGKE